MSDYRGFQDKIGADLASASASAASYEKTRGSKVRIRHSDLEALIPAGSSVEFQPTTCTKLRFGDIIFVRQNKEFVLRRFVGFQLNNRGTATMSVARVQPAGLESYPDAALVGRVTQVESRGQHFDPHKKEGLMDRWRNEWTCFGTSTPIQRMVYHLKAFGRLMKKK